MTDAGAEEFAEFGAAALDAFQALFEQTEHLDHRTNDDHARELLGDLLIDLMHYAEHRNLEFNDVLAQAHGYYLSEQNTPGYFAIGSTVQLEGPAAEEAILLGWPTRGSVTGLLIPDHGPTEYYVRFPGETTNRGVIAADLEPAPPFPATPTAEGIVDDPLRAEEILVETMTRIGTSDIQGQRPQADDLSDHQALLHAFVAWTGMDERSLTDLLLTKVATRLPDTDATHQLATQAPSSLAPGRLAAQAFPVPLTQELASRTSDAPTSLTIGPSDPQPKRPRPGR